MSDFLCILHGRGFGRCDDQCAPCFRRQLEQDRAQMIEWLAVWLQAGLPTVLALDGIYYAALPSLRWAVERQHLAEVVAGYERDRRAAAAEGVEWTWSWRPSDAQARAWIRDHPEVK